MLRGRPLELVEQVSFHIPDLWRLSVHGPGRKLCFPDRLSQIILPGPGWMRQGLGAACAQPLHGDGQALDVRGVRAWSCCRAVPRDSPEPQAASRAKFIPNQTQLLVGWGCLQGSHEGRGDSAAVPGPGAQREQSEEESGTVHVSGQTFLLTGDKCHSDTSPDLGHSWHSALGSFSCIHGFLLCSGSWVVYKN